MSVTGRSLWQYPKQCRNLESGLRYLEVGCGLGEFTPFAATLKGPRPIAIDLFDYDLGKRMLRYARRENFVPSARDNIDVLLDRIAILQDKKKVQLFNMPLAKALEYRSLHHIADVVVDNFGPVYWPEADGMRASLGKKVFTNEGKFLKKGGYIVGRG